MAFLKEFLEKVDFERNQQMTKKNMQNCPVGKELALFFVWHSDGIFERNWFWKKISRRKKACKIAQWVGKELALILFDTLMVFLKEIDFWRKNQQMS